jgi:hypothetical protein
MQLLVASFKKSAVELRMPAERQPLSNEGWKKSESRCHA